MKNSCKVMKKIHFLDSLVNSFNDVNELNIHSMFITISSY